VSACTWLLSLHVLTSPSLYNLQLVSAPCSATFFSCPDASLPLWSPPHEYPSLCCFLFMPRLVPPSAVSRGCPLLSHFLSVSWQVPGVPLAWSLSFHVLTCPSHQSPDCFFLCLRCFTIGIFLPQPSPSCCTPNLPAEEMWITQASKLDTCSALGHGRCDD